LESEVELLKKEVSGYKESSDETEAEKAKAQGTQASYETLVSVVSHYYNPDYKRSKLVDELLAINTASLGEVGISTYNSITKEVYPAECKELYPSAMESYKVLNYTPGTSTPADYTTPSMKNYRSSQQLIDQLYNFEVVEGLNGAIILVHPGVSEERTDRLYDRLEEIIKHMTKLGYSFKSLNEI
jgi:hypothetical protein